MSDKDASALLDLIAASVRTEHDVFSFLISSAYSSAPSAKLPNFRLKDQAQESSNAYKNTLQEIESINSELQTNGQRIDELNAKENLTLVEAEELERLKESNRELENTLALKEKIVQQE